MAQTINTNIFFENIHLTDQNSDGLYCPRLERVCKGTSFTMVSHRGHNCIFSALTILDSPLTSYDGRYLV